MNFAYYPLFYTTNILNNIDFNTQLHYVIEEISLSTTNESFFIILFP